MINLISLPVCNESDTHGPRHGLPILKIATDGQDPGSPQAISSIFRWKEINLI